MKKLAYYKGCLASLSAKELDISTRALAPKLGYELIELESVTCCGAGDIHEAEPDYYLHLNARILSYAEATGCDTLMTVCNVCTLNLRQANYQLQIDEDLRRRVNDNLEQVGVPYDLYIANQTPGGLVASKLATDNHALYNGVILTSGELALSGTSTSALTAAVCGSLSVSGSRSPPIP